MGSGELWPGHYLNGPSIITLRPKRWNLSHPLANNPAGVSSTPIPPSLSPFRCRRPRGGGGELGSCAYYRATMVKLASHWKLQSEWGWSTQRRVSTLTKVSMVKNRDRTLGRAILAHLTPDCQKETLDKSSWVIYTDLVEGTDYTGLSSLNHRRYTHRQLNQSAVLPLKLVWSVLSDVSTETELLLGQFWFV